MLRRIPVLGAFLLVLLPCAAAVAARTYPDPARDLKGGPGPDIRAVTISHTATTLTFRVRFASAPPLGLSQRENWIDMLLIGIDVPPLGPAPSTPGGEWPGANFALGTHGPAKTGQLVRLGTGPGGPPPVRFKVVTQGRTVTVSIPRRALGSPRWFAFGVAAAREGESATSGGGYDVLPRRGTAVYRLT